MPKSSEAKECFFMLEIVVTIGTTPDLPTAFKPDPLGSAYRPAKGGASMETLELLMTAEMKPTDVEP